jgi:hypothetical protein
MHNKIYIIIGLVLFSLKINCQPFTYNSGTYDFYDEYNPASFHNRYIISGLEKKTIFNTFYRTQWFDQKNFGGINGRPIEYGINFSKLSNEDRNKHGLSYLWGGGYKKLSIGAFRSHQGYFRFAIRPNKINRSPNMNRAALESSILFGVGFKFGQYNIDTSGLSIKNYDDPVLAFNDLSRTAFVKPSLGIMGRSSFGSRTNTSLFIWGVSFEHLVDFGQEDNPAKNFVNCIINISYLREVNDAYIEFTVISRAEAIGLQFATLTNVYSRLFLEGRGPGKYKDATWILSLGGINNFRDAILSVGGLFSARDEWIDGIGVHLIYQFFNGSLTSQLGTNNTIDLRFTFLF